MCRSRRELSNEYSLAKFGFDRAKNESYYFEISSSREFDFELQKFEALICSPVDVVMAEEGRVEVPNLAGARLELMALRFARRLRALNAALKPARSRLNIPVYSNFFSNFWLIFGKR